MILTDVNVLLYAHRSELPDHDGCRRWLDSATQGPQRFAVSELVLSAFVRIATNPRVFKQPTPIERALEFTTELRNVPNAAVVSPGPNHWQIFSDLCRATGASGNLVPDAYLAALAIEHDLEWITTDSDYDRFPGLRHRHPLR